MDSFKKNSEKSSINNIGIGNINQSEETNFKDLKTRFISAIVMLSALVFILNLGPLYCCILVIILVTIIFTELINNSRYQDRNNEIKNYYLVCYFVFIVFMYFFNGLTIFHKFKQDKLEISMIKVRIL